LRLLFLNEKFKKDNLYYLSLEDSKHLIANRFSIGNTIDAVIDDKFGKFTIKTIIKKIVYGEFHHISLIKSFNSKLFLIIGLPKDRALIPIVEKSSEIGVNQIYLIPLNHSDRKSLNENQLLRLKKIAIEGCKQSGNPNILKIVYFESLESIFKDLSLLNCIKIFLDEEVDFNNNFFNLINKNKVERFKNVVNLIGPEGGLSSQEKRLLMQNDFYPISLGKNILRTETAAIVSSFLIKSYQNINFEN